MKKLCAPLCWLALLCATSVMRGAEAPATLIVEPLGTGEFDFNPQTGVATATNGVVVRSGKATLTASKVTVDQTGGDVLAEGNVCIEHDSQIWTGERLIYNFQTRQISTAHFKTGQRPFFLSGEGVDSTGTNQFYVATNAVLTTDDYSVPAYTIHAKKITVIPGKQIKATGATVWLGKVPVFYWPYLRRSFETHDNFWTLTPGYRNLFGPYLLTSYHHRWSPEIETALNLDYRQRRGPGLGPDIEWNSPAFGEGKLRYYYTHDDDPEQGPLLKNIPANRQRVWFSHRVALRTNLTARAMGRWQSDNYVARDFFESEYRENVQPSSFLELNQDWANWNLNLYAQAQVNRFQETVERLPDIKLTGLRQELGESPFYYDSESSAGYYRHVWPSQTNIYYPSLTNAYAASRFDTYHQILIPLNFLGWLNVAPRAGGRFTSYGEADGPGAMTREQNRAVFNTGVEVSFKASRLWRNAQSSLLEVNGLRHVIEPSVNYVFVPRPNVPPSQLPQFDSELPGYWLLPITYPNYNAIDAIDSQNVLRFGLRNLLQTKRGGALDNLANWSLLTDWRLQPRANQTSVAPVYSDLELNPRSWLSVNSITRYDPSRGRLQELTDVVTLHPGNVWSWSVGHRYRDHFEFGANDPGNNLILSSLTARLNESWAVRAMHQYEARDGRMEEQSYTLYRDLRSWTVALTFRYRENRSNRDDYSVALTFSLKAFPRYGREQERPSLLLGS